MVSLGDWALCVILAQGLMLQVNMRAQTIQVVPLYTNTCDRCPRSGFRLTFYAFLWLGHTMSLRDIEQNISNRPQWLLRSRIDSFFYPCNEF